MKKARIWLALGAVGGLLTVTFGAFGAHALKGHIAPELIANWNTAAHYLGLHSLALFACGLLLLQRSSDILLGAGWAFLLGILLFCGSLFLMALTGDRAFGMVTPVGGFSLMVGWSLLAVAAWRITADPN
jgi:uncharacterized membrane protein YgdD (TMEM256/DUF423 family)